MKLKITPLSNSVRHSVWDSVSDSVWNSVCDSVWDIDNES